MEDEILRKFNEYIDDAELSLETNPNKTIETSKGLLDSICKTILTDLGIQVNPKWDSPKLIRETFDNSPFIKIIKTKDPESVRKIITAMITLNQGVCELRNSNSFVSHGKDIESNYCESIFARLILDSVKIVGTFIFEIHSKLTPIMERKRVDYNIYEEFNEWYDDIYGEVNLGNFTFSASKTLYNNDQEAYKEAIQDYETSTGRKVHPIFPTKKDIQKNVALIEYKVDSVLPGTVYFDLAKDGKVWFWIANLEGKKYLTYIRTKLKIGNYSEDIKDKYYGGEEPWKLNPFTGIHAPGMPIPPEVLEKIRKGEVLDIIINCEIHDEDDKFIEKKLPVTFKYNFEHKSWGLEP